MEIYYRCQGNVINLKFFWEQTFVLSAAPVVSLPSTVSFHSSLYLALCVQHSFDDSKL